MLLKLDEALHRLRCMFDLLVDRELTDGHLEECSHASILLQNGLLAGVLAVVVEIEDVHGRVGDDAEGEVAVAAVLTHEVVHLLIADLDDVLKWSCMRFESMPCLCHSRLADRWASR